MRAWTIALLTVFLSGCNASPGAPLDASGFSAPAPSHALIPKAITIGSFNSARGGVESLEAPQVAGLNAAIQSMFHPKFRYTGTLTPKFLKSIKVMVIGVAASVSGSEIKPLSSKEKAALLSFAKGGGAVIIFADNSDFQKADNSLLTPFGLGAGGKLGGAVTATWVGNVSQNPLAHGPAGDSQELDTFYPGWFKKLGAARDLADLPGSGEPAASYLQPGALGNKSGPLIFFSDSSLMLDGTRTQNDQTAILNAIALTP